MSSPAVGFALIGISPSSVPLVEALAGVGLFGFAISCRQRRAPSAIVIVLLTVVLGFWLFGAGEAWYHGGETMVRDGARWVMRPGSWAWGAVLALPLAAVACIGGALRALAEGRRASVAAQLALGAAAFVGWCACIHCPSVLAVVEVWLVLMIIGGQAAVSPRDPVLSPEPATLQPLLRTSMFVAIGVCAGFATVFGLLLYAASQGAVG